MFISRWKKLFAPSRDELLPEGRRATRHHNIFEAAASYVSACAEDDEDRIDEAAGWVSPEALSFGISELACRAVIALARERDESPQTVARSLLGLPAA
ncbi:hypothetical protein [Streptomyces beijiangensis]|uniref:Uncharacterized protein n=1 Tax=Streptomyces beijiangensis TaxID=163361 RepID=A0A939JG65_9ACTN|nr:hypothetical protein [Streptomyces beijiangensis]MBO0510755.1 hypothetical protein [Streptomyces beijiangensis]